MLSNNRNKATIIKHTGGEVVNDKQEILQHSYIITDSIYKYIWQLSFKNEGPVKVQPFSSWNKANANKKKINANKKKLQVKKYICYLY